MKKSVLILLIACFACGQNPKLHILGKLPPELNETSAAQLINGLIWTTEDHGNAPELYALDKSGKLVHTLHILDVKNHDWEELTADKQGNLYIGDFGNNENKRKNLAIYKISGSSLGENETSAVVKTTFYYPAQKDFPPKKSNRIFDCESFFVFGNYFYLFSKNRSSGFDGTTILYRVPNMPGNFPAEPISDFQTCGNYNRCAVTSADISPDGKRVVLLCSDKIWLFEGFSGDDFFSGKATKIELEHFSQKEGLCFSSNTELFITDERNKKTGGNLYEFELPSESKP
jgi:hypothetical protein